MADDRHLEKSKHSIKMDIKLIAYSNLVIKQNINVKKLQFIVHIVNGASDRKPQKL